MLSWWPHRNDPHVLWVHFEDLKEDLKANVTIGSTRNLEHPPSLASWLSHRQFYLAHSVFCLKPQVRRVANFIGVAADDQTIATAVTQSSYGFMSANSDKFNERLSKASRNIACGTSVSPAHFRLCPAVGLLVTRVSKSRGCRGSPAGLAPDAGMGDSKVRRGKVGAAQSELSPELREAVQARWNEVMLPATGFETYEQLRAAVHEEQKN